MLILLNPITFSGSSTERAHLLKTVINNITLKSSYYQDIAISCLTFEGDQLLTRYKEYLDNGGS